MFRITLQARNYNAISNPTKLANAIRAKDLQELEKEFWRNELKELVGDNGMKKYYEKRNQKRKIWIGEIEGLL